MLVCCIFQSFCHDIVLSQFPQHCTLHVSCDHFDIETKQITAIFKVWVSQVIKCRHQRKYFLGKFILNTRVLFMVSVGFSLSLATWMLFSNSSMTHGISSPITIHLSGVYGFSVNPTAPPSHLISLFTC